jgi:hypothetical protein
MSGRELRIVPYNGNRAYKYYLDGYKVNGKRRRLFFKDVAVANRNLANACQAAEKRGPGRPRYFSRVRPSSDPLPNAPGSGPTNEQVVWSRSNTLSAYGYSVGRYVPTTGVTTEPERSFPIKRSTVSKSSAPNPGSSTDPRSWAKRGGRWLNMSAVASARCSKTSAYAAASVHAYAPADSQEQVAVDYAAVGGQ